jgi:hypothetical protein
MADIKTNTGDLNTGDSNTGHCNTGNGNTGDSNTGYLNTGNGNTGDLNTGNGNTGHRNTGGLNTGDFNTGGLNTGHRNTGDLNIGNKNTGDWNIGNFNTGYLCTDTPKVRIFNKETDVPRGDIHFPAWMYFDLVKWVKSDDMTEAEKEAHPEHETTGGYLKQLDYKEAAQASYNNATREDQDKVEQLPNYDPEILFEIFGIDRRKNRDSCDGKTVEIDGKKYRLTELK